MSLRITFPDGHTEIEPKGAVVEFWPDQAQLLDDRSNPLGAYPRDCSFSLVPKSDAPPGDFRLDAGDDEC